MGRQTGKYIIIGGMIIVAAGILVYFSHQHLKWIGRLSEDIRNEKESRPGEEIAD